MKSEKWGARQRAFHREDAAAYAREYVDAGFADAKVASFTSTSWQVRIRTELLGQLTKTSKECQEDRHAYR